MNDEVLKEAEAAAEQNLTRQLAKILAVLDDLVETNEILMDRIERLEWVLGIEDDTEHECSCSECAKPPMFD